MDLLTENDIKEVTREVVDTFVIPDFMQRGHNASGNWVASVDVRVDGQSGVITGPRYTGALIEGRQPNKDQDPQAIANWARWYGKHVFDPWVQSKGLGLNPYAVAYTIARHGTKLYRDGGDSDFLKILESQEVQDFIMKRIGDKVTVRVVSNLRNKLKELK